MVIKGWVVFIGIFVELNATVRWEDLRQGQIGIRVQG
jgi:hypothetical protein